MTTRRDLGAGVSDVIDHLLVDAPPCGPDEEREVDTLPMSPEALVLKRALELLEGSLCLDFTEKNVAAILELGGKLDLAAGGPACANLIASYRPPDAYWDRLTAYGWHVYYVESRQTAKDKAVVYPAAYAGWNEPPPPDKSPEQLEADAKQARFEAAEAAMVASAERELAADRALASIPPKRAE